jgi:competence protein ComEC
MSDQQHRLPKQTRTIRQPLQPSERSRATRVLPETQETKQHPLATSMLPDVRGLLLVVLVAGWLAGMLFESWTALPFWLTLVIGGACGILALLARWLRLAAQINRWLTLGLLALACLMLGAGRLALASPAGDSAAVSSYIGRGTVTIRGNVGAEPDLRAHSILLEIDASSLSLDGHTWQNVHGAVAVLTLGTNGPFAPDYGDTVELQGTLEPVLNSPITSSAPASNANKQLQPVAAPAGVFAAMIFPRLSILARGGGNPILAWIFHLRQQLAQAISQSLPEPEASLLIGILLGLKTPVLRSQYALFQQSGTIHLVVTSGFKVTLLSGILAAATRQIIGRRRAVLVVLIGIFMYTLLSGGSPSAIRAGIMGALLAIALSIGRYYNIYTSLAFAALLMSAWSPYLLWDVGFQLSMLGTLGIVLLSPFITRWLAYPLGHAPGGQQIAELLAITLAAQCATLPIQTINFGQLSLIAPLTNLLIVPLLGALLMMGLLVGCVGLALPLAGGWAGLVCWPLLWLVYQIIAHSATLPFASLAIGTLDLRLAWLYYAGLAVIVIWLLSQPPTARNGSAQKLTREQRRRKRQRAAHWRLAAAVFLIAAAFPMALGTLPDQRLHIAWLDVGAHGQAILIQTPGGHTALIDGGSDPTALETALGQQLPFWQRTLDLVVLTNPKAGHLAGLMDIVNHYHILQAADAGMLHPSASYASWRATLEQRSIPYARVSQGETIQLEPDALLQVLSPSATLSTDTQNEDTNALILRLVTPGLRVLLLGETDTTALNNLVSSRANLHADIVQIALQPDQSPETFLGSANLLPVIQPALIVVTPASATTGSASTSTPAAAPATIHTFNIASTGTLALTADTGQWWLDI